MKKRVWSILLCLVMVLSLLPTTALAADIASGLYNISYITGDSFLTPTVSGTENAPTLTFTRDDSNGSGGVITSRYTMDFTRSFNIQGNVTFAERDGVSFALHTNPNKKSFGANYNTCMLGPGLLNYWEKSTTSFTVDKSKNDIQNGLLWDFMQFTSANSDFSSTRFWAGAYSYRIKNGTTVDALADDTSNSAGSIGIKNPGTRNTNGNFLLKWECTDAATATGKLTLTMGANTTFTYTNLNAGAVFGTVEEAKAVYFSFSTWLPSTNTSSNETILRTQIAIDKAYYTDTGDENGSTLGVETAYYIDTDNNGTFETQLKEATLVGPSQTVLCRNKIYNRNKNARSPMDMTLLIPNLSRVTSAEESRITSITDQKFYMHEHGSATETLQSDGVKSIGNGPLNSTAQLRDYATVKLPAGGDGENAYSDAYAVYEYRFTPGENVIILNQTIQLGVAPFTPAVVSSTVYFNSPKALQPDPVSGKMCFGPDNGLYRVVDKDRSSVTLFYDGASVIAGGKAQPEAVFWLTGGFWGSLTDQERAALLPYAPDDGISAKVVLPSQAEVENGGSWSMTDGTRSTAADTTPEAIAAAPNWWLRTLDSDSAAMAVTQNGTDIVPIETIQSYGVRPVLRVNLANVLFIKDSTVDLTATHLATLDMLNTGDSEVSPYRMTLLDADRTFTVTEDGTSANVSPNDTVTLNYSNATVGDNCYVSALLTDSQGQDIYYGRLKAISDPTDTSGTVDVTIPEDGLTEGAYTLKVFSETIRSDASSDAGSRFQAITCNVGNILNGTVFVTGTPQYGCTLAAQTVHSNYLGTLQYQWERNGAVIAGATGSTYTLTDDDINKSITCVVNDSGVTTPRVGTITSASVSVSKRTLTVIADNKSMTQGGTLPELTFVCAGFVSGDTAENVFAPLPSAALNDGVDGKTPGSYPITVTAVLSPGMDDVYGLTITNATLQVRASASDDFTLYPITEGANGQWKQGTDGSLTFRSTGSFSRFRSVTVDGKAIVKDTDYTVAGVSTVIALKPEYLATLAPGKHTMRITFTGGYSETTFTIGDWANPFTDVAQDAYYYGAVQWAAQNGVTSGKTTTRFAPNDTCTRAQTVTLLWRAMGSPAPAATVNPFTDVDADAYYYRAVLWAVEKGITKGTSDITFTPNALVTRSQTAAFLWRAAGSPAATTASTFSDVPPDAYYAAAVLWAAEKGITDGTSATTFSPADPCSRAQIVTFLYRYLGK